MNYLLNYEARLMEMGLEVSFKSSFYAVISSILLVGFTFVLMLYLNISLIDIIGFAFPYCMRLTVIFFAIISLYLSTTFCDTLNRYIKSIGYEDDDNDLNYDIDQLNIALDKILEIIVLLHDFIQGTKFYNDLYQLMIYFCIIANTLEISCIMIIAYLGDWNGIQIPIFLVLYSPGYLMFFSFYYLNEIMNVKV